MKVLHIISNTTGGAAKAALRLHGSLLKNGIDSSVLTLGDAGSTAISNHYIFGKSPKAIPNKFLPEKSNLPVPLNRLFPSKKERIKKEEDFTYFVHKKKEYELFTWNRTQCLELTQLPLFQEADIINLHWVSYFLDWPTFFSKCKKPLVWTMHDMNPFTGGCHYSMTCEKYKTQCSDCPQLLTHYKNNHPSLRWAAQNQEAKRKSLANRPVHVVADSHWLENECRQSSIFSNNSSFQTIHYGIETDVFVPMDKMKAKKKLGIDTSNIIVGFGAENVDNKRKGFSELALALQTLAPKFPQMECLVFGAGSIAHVPGLPKVHAMGKVDRNDSLAEIYSACDIFIVPSLFEAFGQTAIEAMSCGTPVVAFRAGGLVDSVVHRETGMLAEVGNAQDLAEKITLLIENPLLREDISKKARKSVEENFNYDLQAFKYSELYRSIL